MKNINRVVISGNLTREPEVRHTQSGLAVMGLGVAVNDSRKDQQTGQWEDYANFLDCKMLGQRAEKLAPMLSKGAKVVIEGKLRWSQWEKEGQKRSKVEILIDNLEFMTQRGNVQQSEPEQQDSGVYDEGYADSDIPF